MAYDRLEPFGEDRADLRAAIVAQAVTATVAGQDTPEIDAFLPKFGEDLREDCLTNEQIAARIAAAFFGPGAQWGGR